MKSLLIAIPLLFITSACGPLSTTAKGTLVGTGLGAGTGALIGSQTGSTGAVTAVGAGVGALGGAIVGSSLEGQEEEKARLAEKQRLHQQELSRQKREIEEIRRQQRYDDLYRRY